MKKKEKEDETPILEIGRRPSDQPLILRMGNSRLYEAVGEYHKSLDGNKR